MLNENSPQIKNWIQIIAFIFLLLVVFSLRFPETAILPFGDESYHITDELLTSSYWDFNVFKNRSYPFLGHTLGYPLSLKATFSVLGANIEAARIHSLFFSFITLFIFFLIIREFLWFPTAVLITLAFYSSSLFYELTPGIIGDMSFLTFSLLTIYYLYRQRFGEAAVAIFLAAFFRESALALIAGILCSYAFLKITSPRELPTLKKTLFVVTPAFLFLAAFFLNNWLRYDTFSRHPYAQGRLIHTKVRFFEWGDQKWKGLIDICAFILQNFGPPLIIGVGIAIGLRYFINRKNQTQYFPLCSFLFFAFFVLLFFCLYGDTIPRDLLPVICAFFFVLAFSLTIFPKKIQILLAAATLAYSIFSLKPTSPASDVMNYQEMAHFIETKYPDKKIYFGWPLSHLTEKIHGYFSNPPALEDLKSNKIEVIIVDSKMSEMERIRAIESAKRMGLEHSHQFSIQSMQIDVFEKKTLPVPDKKI